MPSIERYSIPITMICGPGAIAHLGEAAAGCGMARPLVVTDRGLRRAGILDRAMAGLGSLGASAAVFEDVSSNPREEDVAAALAAYRSAGADGLAAVGGGSAIDAAKAVRLLAAHPGAITDYDLSAGGARKIIHPMPPLVAVPTTAGTGSEVSRGALIVTRRDGITRKTIVASARLVPSSAVLDPELTLELPPALAAGCGMDALSHCVEEHLSPRPHPVVSAIALNALSRIARALPRIFRSPADIEARGEMLMAAMMAGIGFEKGLGAVHSLSHAIGALHDIHHGTLNAVILPAALEFNREHCLPGTLQDLAAAAGLQARTAAGAADQLIRWIRELAHELGLPEGLRSWERLAADREEIIDRALEDHCHRTNPRRCRRPELIELWERAW